LKKATLFAFLIHFICQTQTTTNPDFSLIGDLLIVTNNDSTTLSHSGVELAFQGYVNPFSKANVYLHVHDGVGLELEEAYLSIERGLPFALGMRTGKFRPAFGKINREHPHTFYFINSPMSAVSVLGEEHWASTGIEINALLPFSWYSQFIFGYTQSGMIAENHDDHTHSHEIESTSPMQYVKTSNFFDLNDITHFEAGLSYTRSNDDSLSFFGYDFKLKWKPDVYRSFTIQSEVFQNVDNETDSEHSPFSAYTWLSYQFNKKWNCGFIADFIAEFEGKRFFAPGLFFGFSPVEESSVFRMKIQQINHVGESEQFIVIGQLIWALGPHKPHRF